MSVVDRKKKRQSYMLAASRGVQRRPRVKSYARLDNEWKRDLRLNVDKWGKL